jgi:hypothetical protein
VEDEWIMAAKIVIALVAFPVLVHAIFTLTRLVLGLLLPELLTHAGSWSEIVSKGAVVAAFLLAVRASFGVCRRLWPAPAVK